MSFGVLNPWLGLWEQIWKTQNFASTLERPPLFSYFRSSDRMLARTDKTCARVRNSVSRSSEHRAENSSNQSLRSSDQSLLTCSLKRRNLRLSETPVAKHRTRARGADLDSCFVKPTIVPHTKAFGNRGLLTGYDAKPLGAVMLTQEHNFFNLF
ncbi:hypothetical protein CsSME_00026861 [Camellia sinensis var. sinensis]